MTGSSPWLNKRLQEDISWQVLCHLTPDGLLDMGGKATLETTIPQAIAKAHVQRSSEGKIQAQGSLVFLPLRLFSPKLQGTLRSTLEATGTEDDLTGILTFRGDAAPTHLEGKAHWRWSESTWRFWDLHMKGPGISAKGHGQLPSRTDPTFPLPHGEISIDIEQLSAFMPFLDQPIPLQGRLALTGTKTGEEMQVSLAAHEVIWEDFWLRTLRGRFHRTAQGKTANLSLQDLRWKTYGLGEAALRLTPDGLSSVWHLTVKTPLKGMLTAAGNVLWDEALAFRVGQASFVQEKYALSLDTPWEIRTQQDHLRWTPLHLTFKEEEKRGRLELRQHQSGFEAHLHHIPLSLGALVIPEFIWKGLISGHITLPSLEDAQWEITVDGLNNTAAENVVTKLDTALWAKLKGAYQDKKLSTALALGAETSDLLTLKVETTDIAFKKPLSWHLIMTGNLFPLVRVFAPSDMYGEGLIDANLTGTLQKEEIGWQPTVTGHLRLQNAVMEDLATNLTVRDLTMDLTAQGTTANLSFSGRDTQKGRLEGTFEALWPDPAHTNLTGTLTLDAFQILAMVELELQTTGLLNLSLTRAPNTSQVTLSGRLTAPHAVYRFDTAHALTFPSLEVDGVNLPLGSTLLLEGPSPPSNWTTAFDIALDLPKAFSLEGYGISSLWGGHLHVTGPFHDPRLAGALVLEHGAFRILGKELLLQKGAIDFEGETPIDPKIDITGTSTGGGVTATLRLVGPTTDLKLHMTSDPPMSEPEIVSHILFGTETQQIGPLQAIILASTLQQIRTGNFDGGLLSKMRQATGLDSLSISTNEAGEGVIGLGKYLDNGIYVGLKGGEEGTTASVQMPITEHLALETDLGTRGTTGIGLNYTYTY